MNETRKYFGDWSNWSEMERSWRGERWSYDDESKPVDGMATDEEVLFAVYTYQDYSGTALVVFERDGKLYENQGGHCSCYGLEGQWSPEETSWAALGMRSFMTEKSDTSSYGYGPEYDYTPEGAAALRELVSTRLAAEIQEGR